MQILGIKIDEINLEQTLKKINVFLDSKDQHQIVTVNPEFIVQAQKDEEFKNILNNADLSVADGFGLRLAAKYLKQPKIQTITGTDLAPEICRIAEQENKKVFFFGGFDNTAELVAKKLKIQFPNLQTDFSTPEAGESISKINNFQPDILFVALEFSRQEKWIAQNLKQMPSVKIAVGVGGAFDYISGKIKRAPEFMRKMGLEWLFRLIRQPKRAKRIFNAVIKFSWLIFFCHPGAKSFRRKM